MARVKKIIVVGALAVVAGVSWLTANGPSAEAKPNPAATDPAAAADPVAVHVPVCEDTADGSGPCVMWDEDQWWYVDLGARYPQGRQLTQACAVETGGPIPCVWVPSAMGNGQGDSGAYVYRAS